MKCSLVLLIFFFFHFHLQGQKLHLYLVSDVSDNQYGVTALAQESKVVAIFDVVKNVLGYELRTKWVNKDNFNSKDVLQLVEEIKRKSSTNDIIVFYYIGRGSYSPNIPTDFPLLEFRNPQKTLSIEEISTKLKNIPSRLVLIVADCNESILISKKNQIAKSRGEVNPQNSGDTLKLEELYDDSPDSTLLKSLSPEELSYFKTTMDSLRSLAVRLRGDQSNDALRKRVYLQLNRVSNYPKVGFPTPTRSLLFRFSLLPATTQAYTDTRDFDCVVDSMYKKKSLLWVNEPLNHFLDTLINLPDPPDESRSIQLVENLKKPILQKLFLSQCGQVLITNGLTHSLPKKEDYTGFLYKNFGEMMGIRHLKEIDKIGLNSLFSKMDEAFVFGYKPTLVTCPSSSRSVKFSVPKFSQIPTYEEITDLFSQLIASNDPVVKKKLMTEIKKNFEPKALITVRNDSSNLPSTASSTGEKYTVDAYLNRLFTDDKSIKKLRIPLNTFKRSENFSKITSLLVVENR